MRGSFSQVSMMTGPKFPDETAVFSASVSTTSPRPALSRTGVSVGRNGGEGVGAEEVEGGVGAVVGERRVNGNHIGLLQNLFQTHKSVFFFCARRVVQQDAAAERTDSLDDAAANVSHADHANGGALQTQLARQFEADERRGDVLAHAAGVAARAVGPRNAGRAQVVDVDVVVADGGGGDEAHAAALQQGAVTAGAGAHNEGIGIAHVGRDNLGAGQIDAVAQPFGLAANIRDFFVDYKFHFFTIDVCGLRVPLMPVSRALAVPKRRFISRRTGRWLASSVM